MTHESTDETDDLQDLTPARVIAYLKENSDFFVRHPEAMAAMAAMAAPGRELGEGVADLQQVMIERLKRDVAGSDSREQELVDTSRANLTTQSRIHECVLALLAANSFEQVIQTVTTDFAVILGVDVVALCIEVEENGATPINVHGLNIVPKGTVGHFTGAGDAPVLRDQISGDPEVFGGAAPLVQSDAMARLDISSASPSAMVAFGSREADRYHPGQSTELLSFLAAVLEHVVRGWLNLPD